MTQQHKIHATPSIAIIGGGFAGLTLANTLGRHYRVTIFEANPPDPQGIYLGDIHVPSARHILKRLKLHDDAPSYIARDACLQLLRRNVAPRYQCRIVAMDEHRYLHSTTMASYGPYDYVVACDGVLTRYRNADTFLIGDARWCQDVWWDFGMTRIRRGADTAMQDGYELGQYLLRRIGSDASFVHEKYSAERIVERATRRRWMMRVAMIVIACMIQRVYSYDNARFG